MSYIVFRKAGVFMSDFEHAMQEARKLSGTPEGKQLAALLQQLGGTDMQQAMEQAASGDFRQAKQAIMQLMQNPEARSLLEKLGGNNGK